MELSLDCAHSRAIILPMNTLYKVGVAIVLGCFVLLLVLEAIFMQPPSVALNAARARTLSNPVVVDSSVFSARCFGPRYDIEGRALDGKPVDVVVCCSFVSCKVKY